MENALLQRVRKLLDKAEATENPYEADAFSSKAADLIARHRIDPRRLEATQNGSQRLDELSVREIELGRGAYVRARLSLLVSVAGPNDVEVVFMARSTGTVALAAGFSSDLDVVELLYTSLHQQAANQMAGIRKGSGAATQRFRRSFLFGFADRIGTILDDAAAAASSTESVRTSTTSGAVALELAERKSRVRDFAASSFGRVRTARRPSSAQPGGYQAGESAAARADVGRVRVAGRRAIGRGD